MNNSWKRLTLFALGAGMAASVAFATVATTFAQDSTQTQDQTQTQPNGSSSAQRGGPGGMHRGGGRHGFAPAAIAKALGITEAELRTAQQEGKSVADLATEKGVALDSVIAAIVADETTRLDQAVTNGKITQEQADQRLADLTEKLPDMLSQTPPANAGQGGLGGFERGGKLGGHAGSPTVIAEALGVTEDELRTAFQEGKSVAVLAEEKGIALNTVVSAIVSAESERLTQAVTDGKLTQEQADQRIADLKERLPDMLSQTPKSRPEGAAPRGFGGPGNDPNNGQNDQQPPTTPEDSSSGSSSSTPALQSQSQDA